MSLSRNVKLIVNSYKQMLKCVSKFTLTLGIIFNNFGHWKNNKLSHFFNRQLGFSFFVKRLMSWRGSVLTFFLVFCFKFLKGSCDKLEHWRFAKSSERKKWDSLLQRTNKNCPKKISWNVRKPTWSNFCTNYFFPLKPNN
jgi:hypothetical protein